MELVNNLPEYLVNEGVKFKLSISKVHCWIIEWVRFDGFYTYPSDSYFRIEYPLDTDLDIIVLDVKSKLLLLQVD